jgi:hypothetical protein
MGWVLGNDDPWLWAGGELVEADCGSRSSPIGAVLNILLGKTSLSSQPEGKSPPKPGSATPAAARVPGNPTKARKVGHR